MTGLDCPMQTKALHLFWHKAELRLVEQQAPEAPVFAVSRPTLFGGREEFLLQYPARLEPPTERDIARHRFTVRHGKKRRSFQAPDAATFEAWLSALEQALEPKAEPDHSPTPSSTSSNATTAVSSQGKMSTSGSTTSSRGKMDTAGCNMSSQRSNVSSQRSNVSATRAPPLRLTLEWPCFTRDPNNFKLIWLHRPAWAVPSPAKADKEADVGEQDASTAEFEEEGGDGVTDGIEFGEEALQGVSETDEEEERDNDVLSVFTDEEAPEEGSHEFVDVETDTVSAEEEFDYCDLETITDDEGSMPTTAIATSPVNASKFEELVDMVPRKADGSKNVESTAIPEGVAVAKAESPRLVGTASADSHGVVEAVLETLVDAVVKHSSIDEAACVGPDAGVEPPEGEEAAKALVPAVSRPRIDGVEAFDELTANEGEVNDAEASERTAPESLVAEVSSPENSKEGIFAVEGVVSPATPRSSKKRSVVKSSKRSASIASKFKWVPLDPTNSSLIWVQGSADADTKSAPRSNPRRKTSRKWSPVDPSNSRLIWVQRVEAAARVESRYKATSSSRKWVPLEPDNSKYIWIRRQPSSGASSVGRHAKQQQRRN
ncbi:hypothetical protein PHYSODRAFT_344077 [Phytophthora sojae]|uniref:PH domain-containing protein n=1 Tax=Phytophthora sojae (strain P6497) TaxID=1094619 RepID=G4YE39_PHYSP|nr:hypothetical protein PHYSODRAFT_344077 [Phytophthora sojae]EGZ29620.1 hypothetical protein PHYSODRAFT_344077 [Phytophthora sojae]|eukprot:XP_009516895.1 hypothetical protein PHYSODRAFT_344077 [Phytophthora sojae]